MASGFQAKWLNRDSVMAALNNLSPLIEKELAIKQLEVAGDLAARIRARAPIGGQKGRRSRGTGQYRRSIIAGRLADNPGRNALKGIGVTKDKNATGIYAEFIWRWLEFGTVKMLARPHVFPTYRQRKKYMVRTMRRAINTGIKKAMAGQQAIAPDNG